MYFFPTEHESEGHLNNAYNRMAHTDTMKVKIDDPPSPTISFEALCLSSLS